MVLVFRTKSQANAILNIRNKQDELTNITSRFEELKLQYQNREKENVSKNNVQICLLSNQQIN